MNPLHDVLQQYYQEQMNMPKETITTHFWRQAFHVEAPMGWLNDPNGALQIDGVYHLYYQYAPHDAAGGIKYWGHMRSDDLVHFKDEGVALYPDQPYDLHGVYSGSAFIENGVIHYFYTGNVKHLGHHDYITSGREQNTIHAISRDNGATIEKQQVVIAAADYPPSMSNHIRDPKVRKINGTYYMVLGARDLADQGQVLVYRSDNLDDWVYHGVFFGPLAHMGYMWECPDFFQLGDQEVLLVSPQGIDAQPHRFQNIYQSGYYLGSVDWETVTFTPDTPFQELDYGFDFYAPQTFTDERGRQILWGWMGLPDAEYENPTVPLGWQHAMTLPRVLEVRSGKLYQQPHENYQVLRDVAVTRELNVTDGTYEYFSGQLQEIIVDIETITELSVQIKGDTNIHFQSEKGLLTLQLNEAGYGRKQRTLQLEQLTGLQLFVDRSSLEVFINQGEYVMTTRMYPDEHEDKVEITGKLTATVTHYSLREAK
ncbi:beta-fructofuranosidase [Streptohalobacillus salinus]|uniref:Sucrose-6-phosphate hydrolase n=1 Tax=Streptohalobacillus salinus TaxID=621096 RepID=A0A2V3WFN9_9BACI|nr:glycoside hydrolase family 32 protein [Streptohalobacillus salinus]PXW93095.1 beta-fructofuranosidase [Streptohalobacillus salinus]